MSLRAISVIGSKTGAFDTRSLDLGTPNTTKYLMANDSASLSRTTAMSFVGWIKGATPSGTKCIVGKYDTNGNNRSYLVTNIQVSPFDKMEVRLSGNGQNQAGGQFKQYSGSIAILDGNWHQVAYTWGSSTLKMYVDGVEDTGVTKDFDDSFSALFDTTADFYVGAQFTGPATVGAKFDGNLDEYSLWSVALSAGEIAAIYNGGTPISLTASAQYANLVSWWRFGENADNATTVFDLRGTNNLTGTNLVSGDFSSSVP